MQVKLFAAVTCITLLIACQQNPATNTVTPAPGCVLSKTGVDNVQIGAPIPSGLTFAMMRTAEGEFKAYQVKKANGEVRAKVYPITLEGSTVETAHLIEYIGTDCGADKGLKVGSTLGDILAAYPDTKVGGSEIEGRTSATAGGWTFLLNCNYWESQIDPTTLDPKIKVKAIILQ